MLSPLEGGGGGEAGRRSDATTGRRQHFPWATHESQCCDECWLDIEAGSGGEQAGRLAVMRAPGGNNGSRHDDNHNDNKNKNNDEAKDELVVVETMIQVSSVGNAV